MRFLSIFLLSALLTLANCQVDKILRALNLTTAHVEYLDGMVYRFNGNPYTGTLDAVNIQQEALVLGRIVQYTTQVVEATPALDDATSLEIVTPVLTLVPLVENLLKRIQSKKSAFQLIVIGLFDVTGQVQETLVKQKTLTHALGYSIAEKLTGAFKTAAPALIDALDAAFDSAIAAYSA